MQAIPFYLKPELARANLIRARVLNDLRRSERARAKRQAAEFEAACAELKRVGWDAEAARELAHSFVYGTEAL